jgi:hypothetical protein
MNCLSRVTVGFSDLLAGLEVIHEYRYFTRNYSMDMRIQLIILLFTDVLMLYKHVARPSRFPAL